MAERGSGLELSAGQIGFAGAIYITGAVSGALFFGYLTDRYGRKKLFLATLALYLCGDHASSPWWFYLYRFFTGAGIGGEYAAINSAIDELMPARLRGRIALFINGSYWAR
jgi:MFS family permease